MTDLIQVSERLASPLPGVKVMLLGESGVGKTYSTRTLLNAGLEIFVLATETGFDVLGDIPSDRLHWCMCKPSYGDLSTLLKGAEGVASLSYEALTKQVDNTRMLNNKFIPLLGKIMNFTDDRTGISHGNVSTWGTDKVLVIDSLSGLSEAVTTMVIGTKAAMSPPDYQIAQRYIYNLIQQACYDWRCHVVLICHAEREIDEVLGGAKIMAQTIGKKLAPQLPKLFTDVIFAKRQATKYFWDTADPQAALKTRNLTVSNDLKPDFVPIINSWKKRGGLIETPPLPNAA